MNVLIGDISSYKAIAVAKFIKNNYPNIRIIGFDTRKFTERYHTKFIHENIIISDNDINTYLNVINKNKIDFFFPVINENLNEIWKNKELFGKSLNYLGDYKGYQLLNDKNLLHNLALSLGIRVPQKYGNLEEAIIPYVVKPTNLSSSKGVIYVDSPNSKPVLIDHHNIIIQEFVKGIGVGYSFYCKDGVILNSYGHKRLAEYPVSGGSSTYRDYFYDERMHKAAERIVGEIGYTGFAMFEFKLDKNNNLYLLEVNPRIWGSINQGLVNGVNYFESALGKSKIEFKESKFHYKTYLSPLIYISFLKYILSFRIEEIKTFFKYYNLNRSDVSLLNDTRGYFSTILRKIRS
jgi:predicted ATP-grasp superfamily ATP-dependent carboligase